MYDKDAGRVRGRWLRTGWIGVVAIALVALAIAAGGTVPAGAASGYSVIVLGALPGGSRSSAAAVNGSGVVVGYSNAAGVAGFHATVWKRDPLGEYRSIDLTPNLSNGVDRSGSAVAISDSGLVVGSAWTGLEMPRATVWRPTRAGGYEEISLPALPGTDLTWPTGVNAQGLVVGTSADTHGTAVRPTEWRPNAEGYTAIDLGTPAGSLGGTPNAVGPTGLVVGELLVPGPPGAWSTSHAAIWTPTSGDEWRLTDLGTLPNGNQSGAAAVNGAGLIVGAAGSDAVSNNVPVVWRRAEADRYSASVLPGPNGPAAGGASAVNSAGVVAGGFVVLSGFPTDAAVWSPSRDGYRVTLLPPQNGDAWCTASGISPNGAVVGACGADTTYEGLAVLWQQRPALSAVSTTRLL